jgi:large subunit ribosomal protein L18
MVSRKDSNKARKSRHARIRTKISGTADRPRLSVYRSLSNIYAQLIDDEKGVTLASASTVEKGFENYGGNKDAAELVGKNLAERAVKLGIT